MVEIKLLYYIYLYMPYLTTPPPIQATIQTYAPQDILSMEDALEQGYFSKNHTTLPEINKMTNQEIAEWIQYDPIKILEELLVKLTKNNTTNYKMISSIEEKESDGRPIYYTMIELDSKTSYKYITLYYDFPEKQRFKIDIIPSDFAQPTFSFVVDGNLPKNVTSNELLRFIKTNISCIVSWE